MQTVNKLMMVYMAVNDMPKAKEFYAETLGLKIMTDYRQNDENWWVSVAFPEGGVTLTLSTFHGNTKPGTINLYFSTPNIAAAHRELSSKGMKLNEIKDDLFGPGSGVKWFEITDPDGNQIKLVQA